MPLRVFDFDSALVRRPGRSVTRGLSATPGPPPVYEQVLAEHEAYVAALRDARVDVAVLPPLEEFPDSVFVEDPALVFTHGAILLRPGAPSRRDEARGLAGELRGRFAAVLELEEGFADGGDVLVTPGQVFIGLSARTDEAGAECLQWLLRSMGLASKVVDVPEGTLHLKTDCSLVDEDTVLASAALATSGLFDGYRVLRVPEEERAACNAIRVNDTVLMRAGCPRTQELLTRHGLRVVALPTAEIAKIDAGLSCMSLRWSAAAR